VTKEAKTLCGVLAHTGGWVCSLLVGHEGMHRDEEMRAMFAHGYPPNSRQTEQKMSVEKLVALQRKTLGPLIEYTKDQPPLVTGDAFDDTWLDHALKLGVQEVRFVYNGPARTGDPGNFGAVAVFDDEHWVSLVGHGNTPLAALQKALLDAQAVCDRP